MRPTQTERTVESNLDTTESRSFTIAATALAFRTLVSGLYSDKILSIVRELCTNAFDGHQRAGNANEPFDVTLPSRLDPMFTVRDYGCGMTHDFVMNLYSTLFHSDKRETNSEVGMLGLGSKSPLAYTDSFFVKCFDGQSMRLYVIGLDADGTPKITPSPAKPSTERAGMSVSFAVDPAKFSEFRSALVKVALGFDVRPNFESDPGAPKFQVERGNVKAWRGDGGYRRQALIRQGCVNYPMPGALANDLSIPEGWNAIIDVPIGTVDVTASRESLELTPRTTEALRKLVATANDHFNEYVADQVAVASDDYERVILTYEFNEWPAVRKLPTSLVVIRATVPRTSPKSTLVEDIAALAVANERGEETLARLGHCTFTRMSTGRNPYETIVSEVGARNLKALVVLHDPDHAKLPRKRMRIKAWMNRSTANVIYRGSKANLAKIAAYFHITPDRIITVEHLPDVSVSPRQSNRTGGSPITKAADVKGTPWIARNGKTHSYEAMNTYSESSMLPSMLRNLAELVGVDCTGIATLTPSQSVKANPNDRWDVLLLNALKASSNFEQHVRAGMLLAILTGNFGAYYRNPYRDVVCSLGQTIALDLVKTLYPSYDDKIGISELNLVFGINDLVDADAIKAEAHKYGKALREQFPMLFELDRRTLVDYIAERGGPEIAP